MVYRSCKHRVYPNQKQEKLFRQYLGNSHFIHNNIIGEIEYNRRIANILMLDHHMLIEVMLNPYLII